MAFRQIRLLLLVFLICGYQYVLLAKRIPRNTQATTKYSSATQRCNAGSGSCSASPYSIPLPCEFTHTGIHGAQRVIDLAHACATGAQRFAGESHPQLVAAVVGRPSFSFILQGLQLLQLLNPINVVTCL